MSPSRLGVLRQACIECKACALGQRPVTEVTPVFGRRACETEPETLAVLDPTDVRLVIVGEAPGPTENKLGRPFAGPAGGILDSLLHQARIDTGAVWITNAVACWPHEAGKGSALRTVPPDDVSIASCARHLAAQLDAFPEARIILALGMTAATALLSYSSLAKSLAPMLAFRPGEVATSPRVWPSGHAHRVLVTYHPSYLARRGFKDGDRADGHEDAAVVLKALVAAGKLAEAIR